MALKPCRECGTPLATSIQGPCPRCGAIDPLRKELAKSLAILVLMAIAVGYLWLASNGVLPGLKELLHP